MEDTPISSNNAAIQNRHRHLQRLLVKMQAMTDQCHDEGHYDHDGLLHSNVTVREDASHMSAISCDSRTVDMASDRKSPAVLREQHSASIHQEVKIDVVEKDSISSRCSVEPEGEYEPQQLLSEDRYKNAPRTREEAIERYSSLARKKASLMTNHNFDKGDTSKSASRLSGKSFKSPPLALLTDHSDGTFVGQSIASDDGSSVSSMTSMDSYMKQQYILRELERLRARELKTSPIKRRDKYANCRRSAVDNSDRSNRMERDDSRRSISNKTRSISMPRDGSHQHRHRVGDLVNMPIQESLSSHNHSASSRSRRYDDRSHSASSKSHRHDDRSQFASSRSRRHHDRSKITSTTSRRHDDRSHSTSSRSRRHEERSQFASSRSSDDAKSFNNLQACAQSHNTSHTPPLSQIEECCIKHPDVLLSDQTDVNVWTCMRYCKDEDTGRWFNKKKVCYACLEEDEVSAYHETSTHSYHDKKHQERSYEDEDRTHSMTSSSSDGDIENRNTVNVYTDDGNQTPLEREAEAQRRRFIRRLAARAYHFPGNTWCEDWTQYVANTHIVFGIFFHHPLHPVTSRERLIILLGSVAVGLLMSNIIYLWFLHKEFGMNDVFIHIDPGLDITKLNITLWTLGSFVHTIFDLSVWHIKACTLCRYGGDVSDTAVNCGRRSGVTIVTMTLAFATYLCLVRASQDAHAEIDLAEGNLDPNDDIQDAFFHPVTLAGSRKSFHFLIGYIIEFVLAAFVYSPVMLTVVFTGVLGCNGKVPILGGRPREMAKEQRYAMKRQRYIMPRTLKLGNEEFQADMWGDEELMTKF